MHRVTFISVSLSLVAYASSALGQIELVNRFESPRENDSSFAREIRIDNERILATGGSAFYLMDTNGNLLRQFADESNGQNFSSAGNMFDLAGDSVAIAGRQDDTQSGFVRAYDLGDNTSVQLLPDDSMRQTGFGYTGSVATNGSLVVVGDPFDDFIVGAVYLFDATTGERVAKVTGDINNPQFGSFGSEVDVNESYLVVRDGLATGDGLVRVFDTDTQEFLRTIETDPTEALGMSMVLDGNHLLTGASSADNFQGKAYVHNLDTGSVVAEFSTSDDTSGTFGNSADIDGNIAVIGAKGSLGQPGAVYVFDVRDGSLIQKITAPVQFTHENFGDGVAIEGDVLVVSARAGGIATEDAIYVYRVPEPSSLVLVAIGLAFCLIRHHTQVTRSSAK